MRIRAGTGEGTIHLNSNGSLPGGLRRLVAAGLDSICFRIAASRAATYEPLHGPEGYRFPDVRASIRLVAELPVALSLLVLVHPGIFDRPDELAALVAIMGKLPEGSTLLLRDLHSDPLRALALVPARGEDPLGVTQAVDRIREEIQHVRIGAFVRPLARVPHVP